MVYLEEKYGKDKAKSIIDDALLRYDELIKENENEPKAYYTYTRERIYPSIAVFDVLTKMVSIENKLLNS